jgi:hypothetical protein
VEVVVLPHHLTTWSPPSTRLLRSLAGSGSRPRGTGMGLPAAALPATRQAYHLPRNVSTMARASSPLIETEVSVAVVAVAFERPDGLAPYPPADRISSRGLDLYRGASLPNWACRLGAGGQPRFVDRANGHIHQFWAPCCIPGAAERNQRRFLG